MRNYFKAFVFPALAAGAFSLAGCWDGYEMSLYDSFPYGNARTAGSGVTYVLARMMPEKGPVLDEIIIPPEAVAAPAPAPEPVPEAEPEPVKEFPKEAEELFRQMQQK